MTPSGIAQLQLHYCVLRRGSVCYATAVSCFSWFSLARLGATATLGSEYGILACHLHYTDWARVRDAPRQSNLEQSPNMLVLPHIGQAHLTWLPQYACGCIYCVVCTFGMVARDKNSTSTNEGVISLPSQVFLGENSAEILWN